MNLKMIWMQNTTRSYPIHHLQAALQCSGELNGKSYLRFVYLSLRKNPENPLSLLGQYSDDELDDVPNKAKGESPDKTQATESPNKQLEEGEIGENEELSYEKADDHNRQNDSVSPSASQVVNDDLMNTSDTFDEKKHEDVEKEDPASLASDDQTAGDVSLSWKMVLHEESNRYYYWNTVTGETSWEIPEGLVQGTALTDVPESLRKDMKEIASGDVYNATVSADEFSAGHGVGYTNGVTEMKMVYEQVVPEGQSLELSKGDDNQLLGNSLLVGALPCETPNLGNYILPEQYNAVGSLTLGSYAVHDHNVVGTEESAHLPSHLVQHCETLLENLKMRQGSCIDPDRDQSIILSRYVSEIEVRLSDIRALLPYGSSLLPFWVHTERQLNQLANSVNSEIGKENNKINGSYINSSKETHVLRKGTGDDTKADTTLTKLSPEISSGITNEDDTSVGTLKSSLDKEFNGSSFNVAKTSMPDPIIHPHFDMEGGTKVCATDLHENSSSKLDSQAVEDVDMDIDMEVEADTGGPLEDPSKLVQPSTSIIGESLVPYSESFIPPPPDEEWIPPPPPDDEGIPPPPPDEPPESLCPLPPPSELEGVQAIYGQQYNMNYADSNVNYYENGSTMASGSSFYEHDSSHIAAVSLPVCFATNQQPIALPNPADTAVYYGPLADTIGSSSSQSSASFADCNSHSALEMTLSGTFLNQASSASVVSAPATVSAKHHASVPSYSATETATLASDTLAAVSEASAAISKTKASRMKKPKVSVGSSLRSNKKVSSLVDKWKAAKEELEEEEERYESPLEILEKKRQREIEDWRAQQIASGEAKENANFQPLGGNWRERVKRRRAKKEAATETPSVPIIKEIKQPDLKALAKDLPPSWQVYWDDSSKQIYYSNSSTSETTWTRPTQ
ncbi:uncharacterized protein LOC141637903 isoform X2 [Silene latifolia]|uniref:uncharacterized protein LOC141637903 isoform X2 n=1 Tax=Silene latifolia TaxID=37657 RepID=UPI003D788613